jgi:hypothetical protein
MAWLETRMRLPTLPPVEVFGIYGIFPGPLESGFSGHLNNYFQV